MSDLDALLAAHHDPQRLLQLYNRTTELLNGFAAGDLSKINLRQIDEFEQVIEARFFSEKCFVAWVRAS